MNERDPLTGAALPTSTPQPSTVHICMGDPVGKPKAARSLAQQADQLSQQEKDDSMATIKERILSVLREATAPVQRQALAAKANVGEKTFDVTVPEMKRAGLIVANKGHYVLAGRESLFEDCEPQLTPQPNNKAANKKHNSKATPKAAPELEDAEEIDKPANTDYVLAQMAALHPDELSTARIVQLCSNLHRAAVEKSIAKLLARKDSPIERVRAGVYRSLLNSDQARNLRPRIKPVIGFKGFDAAIHSDGSLAITAGPNASNAKTLRLNRQQSLALARFIREAEAFFPE